jgi:hypothetical protein
VLIYKSLILLKMTVLTTKKGSVCFTIVLVFLHCMLCTSLRIAANYSWFHEFVLLFLCIEHLYKDDMYCGIHHTHTGLKHVLEGFTRLGVSLKRKTDSVNFSCGLFFWISWSLKMGPISWPEMSVRNYYYMIHNTSLERRYHMIWQCWPWFVST